MLAGFALVVLSINVFKRKKRAFFAAVALACLSIVFHLTKGLDYEEATFSFVLLIALLAGRKEFTVKSGIPDFRDAAVKVTLGIALTLAYGIAGFWLLDRREFGIDFTLYQAVRSTASLLLFAPEPYLFPYTTYARWFLEWRASAISLVMVGLQALSFWMVMPAFGLNLPVMAGFVVFFIVHIGTALPNAPGNIGSYQFFAVLGLTLFGVDKPTAAGFSFVVFFLLSVPLWIIGFFALSRTGLSFRQLRREITSLAVPPNAAQP